jgi:transposase InsO family protein
MNIHKNARTAVFTRALIVERYQAGETARDLSQRLGVSPATIHKWLRRHRNEGAAGLNDRSSRPHLLQTKLTDEQRMRIEAKRCDRWPCWKIAREVGSSPATVARACKRIGLSRLANLDPKEPIIRYEKDQPGEMIHIDIKRLGRIEGIGHRITGERKGQSNRRGTLQGGKGWEYLHLAVDDHSRLAYSEIFPDEKRKSCIQFLLNALRYFRSLGVRVDRVMTDNGVSFKSFRYAKALRLLKIKHKRTRPYTPKTNGKAERFVQTSLREWAYARPYAHSNERAEALAPFLHQYNYHRPHFGLKGKTPISRLSVNNLVRHDI